MCSAMVLPSLGRTIFRSSEAQPSSPGVTSTEPPPVTPAKPADPHDTIDFCALSAAGDVDADLSNNLSNIINSLAARDAGSGDMKQWLLEDKPQLCDPLWEEMMLDQKPPLLPPLQSLLQPVVTQHGYVGGVMIFPGVDTTVTTTSDVMCSSSSDILRPRYDVRTPPSPCDDFTVPPSCGVTTPPLCNVATPPPGYTVMTPPPSDVHSPQLCHTLSPPPSYDAVATPPDVISTSSDELMTLQPLQTEQRQPKQQTSIDMDLCQLMDMYYLYDHEEDALTTPVPNPVPGLVPLIPPIGIPPSSPVSLSSPSLAPPSTLTPVSSPSPVTALVETPHWTPPESGSILEGVLRGTLSVSRALSSTPGDSRLRLQPAGFLTTAGGFQPFQRAGTTSPPTPLGENAQLPVMTSLDGFTTTPTASRAASSALATPRKKAPRKRKYNKRVTSTDGDQLPPTRGRLLHFCPICSKGFKDRYSVNVHIRTHTGEKPFKCTLCCKCFRQKAHLAKHVHIHSSQKPPPGKR